MKKPQAARAAGRHRLEESILALCRRMLAFCRGREFLGPNGFAVLKL